LHIVRIEILEHLHPVTAQHRAEELVQEKMKDRVWGPGTFSWPVM
jgi:hypothetical protein